MADDTTGKGAGSTGEGGGNGEGSQTTLTQEAFDALSGQVATLTESLKHTTTQAVTRKAKNKALEGELETLRKAKADGTTNVDDKGKQYQEIFDNKDSEIAKLNNKLRDINVYGAVREIATRLGATHPDDVVTLLKGRITFDDKGDTVIDGGKLNDKTGKPFTLDELTTGYLAGRQDRVKSSGNAGAGSTGGSTGGGSGTGKTYTRAAVKAMSHTEYAKAKAENGDKPLTLQG